jgi:hypothetical protein
MESPLECCCRFHLSPSKTLEKPASQNEGRRKHIYYMQELKFFVVFFEISAGIPGRNFKAVYFMVKLYSDRSLDVS